MKTYLIETTSSAIKISADNVLEALGYAETAGYRMGTVLNVTTVPEKAQNPKAGPEASKLTYTARLNALERQAQAMHSDAPVGSVNDLLGGYVLDILALLRDLTP